MYSRYAWGNRRMPGPASLLTSRRLNRNGKGSSRYLLPIQLQDLSACFQMKDFARFCSFRQMMRAKSLIRIAKENTTFNGRSSSAERSDPLDCEPAIHL